MGITRFNLFLFAMMYISSCSVGPDYEPPQQAVTEGWKHPQDQEKEIPEVCNWWEVFGNEVLNDLMLEAIEYNHDIKAAIERVVQARAVAGIAESSLYPQLNLNPGYSNQIYLTEAYAANVVNKGPKIPIPFFREHLLAYTLPLNLSWEIDLWGQLRDIYLSAIYEAEAEYEAFRNLLLLLTTDLADSYFRIQTLDAQIDLYLETIQTRKKALAINEDRYQSKLINYEAVSQAALDLANVEADYYESIRLRRRLENSIATLIGVESTLFSVEHHPLKGDPPFIPAGIPSEVLMQRPDIHQSERERVSEHEMVKAAYAAFFPSFSLTGALGFSSPDLRHFLSASSRYWSVGANALQIVFDGGKLTSNLQLQWAKFGEADQNFQQAVLTALQEVNDALGDIEMFYKEAEQLSISVQASTKTYDIAKDRYFEGVAFYLPVVDSERDKLNAQRSFNSVQGLRYSATIQLIKALGGTW